MMALKDLGPEDLAEVLESAIQKSLDPDEDLANRLSSSILVRDAASHFPHAMLKRVNTRARQKITIHQARILERLVKQAFPAPSVPLLRHGQNGAWAEALYNAGQRAVLYATINRMSSTV